MYFWAKSPCLSMLSSNPASLTSGDAALQYLSTACSIISYSNVGGVLAELSSCAFSEIKLLLLTLMTSMLVLPSFATITSKNKLSSSCAKSSLAVFKQDSASAAEYVMPAWWMAPKSNSKSRRREHAPFLVQYVKFRIHFRELWSVRMINRVLSRKGCSRSTVQTITMYFCCVVSF